jgi:hypothetical protein
MEQEVAPKEKLTQNWLRSNGWQHNPYCYLYWGHPIHRGGWVRLEYAAKIQSEL